MPRSSILPAIIIATCLVALVVGLSILDNIEKYQYRDEPISFTG